MPIMPKQAYSVQSLSAGDARDRDHAEESRFDKASRWDGSDCGPVEVSMLAVSKSAQARVPVPLGVGYGCAVFLTGAFEFGYTRRYFTSEDRWSKTHVS